MEEADLLLDRPSGGWDELVTKDWLHLELGALDAKFSARFDATDQRFAAIESRLAGLEKEFRAQTWKLIAAMTGLLGALVAAIKL